MKHLIKYKLFEDNSNLKEEIISDIKDMFLDLSDDLFQVGYYDRNDGIEIVVNKNIQFKWEDVSNVMTRLNNYLISTGIEITISYFDDILDAIIITNNKKYQGKKYRSSSKLKERKILKLNNNTLCDHFAHYHDRYYFIIYIDFNISDTIEVLYEKPI